MPPANIFTFNPPFDSSFTLSAHAAKILLAMNALGGSKVANLSSIESAMADVPILRDNAPKINPINVPIILHSFNE